MGGKACRNAGRKTSILKSQFDRYRKNNVFHSQADSAMLPAGNASLINPFTIGCIMVFENNTSV